MPSSLRLAALSFILFCAFCTPALAAPPLSSGTMTFHGMERSYFYFLPEKDEGQKRPLLIALHGGGKANGDEYAQRTGYNEIAAREGFMVIYPNGVDAQWNDGRNVTFRGAGDNRLIDDVGYINALMDLFVAQYDADPERIYIEGTSNGGMMVQRIACALSDKLAGAASVIAGMPENIEHSCKPTGALPMLLMNATNDPWVPYNGGEVSPLGQPSGKIIPSEQLFRFWSERNGCRPPLPKVTKLPDTVPEDGSLIFKQYHPECRYGVEVAFYIIREAGHSRPGTIGHVPEKLLGRNNKDISASEEIWSFFKRFTLTK